MGAPSKLKRKIRSMLESEVERLSAQVEEAKRPESPKVCSACKRGHGLDSDDALMLERLLRIDSLMTRDVIDAPDGATDPAELLGALTDTAKDPINFPKRGPSPWRDPESL